MAEYKSVPIRTIYKILKKLEAKGELEAFLTDCEKSKQQARVSESLYQKTVMRMTSGNIVMAAPGTDCPCIGPDD